MAKSGDFEAQYGLARLAAAKRLLAQETARMAEVENERRRMQHEGSHPEEFFDIDTTNFLAGFLAMAIRNDFRGSTKIADSGKRVLVREAEYEDIPKNPWLGWLLRSGTIEVRRSPPVYGRPNAYKTRAYSIGALVDNAYLPSVAPRSSINVTTSSEVFLCEDGLLRDISCEFLDTHASPPKTLVTGHIESIDRQTSTEGPAGYGEIISYTTEDTLRVSPVAELLLGVAEKNNFS